MKTWYECRVKALKIDNNGYERKVTDTYLLDAVSYTDAEARIIEEMQQRVKGEFKVLSIKQSNITEIIDNANGKWWWKAKISIITIDEEQGREKKVNQYILVSADQFEGVAAELNKGMEYMLVPYKIEMVSISQIADVFPHES